MHEPPHDPRPPHPHPHPPYEPPYPRYEPPHPPYDPHLTYPWRPPPVPPPPRRRPAPRMGSHADLRLVRRAYKRLRRVASLTALGSFTLFLILSAYAPSLVGHRITGGLNLGLLLLLAQIPVTYVAIALYQRHAVRRVDPLAERLRRAAELESRP
ncbi:DUF485 domain-containing protein [Streptomyces sp. N35]|uniref:DUF485 domain-containing protein n=1 Tax=Streptomyces sp. N35 TaxID=2795730 RepID=UPI0018F4E717|nr:DUF485 domain-containing protein [Streptomyces sp. N35]